MSLCKSEAPQRSQLHCIFPRNSELLAERMCLCLAHTDSNKLIAEGAGFAGRRSCSADETSIVTWCRSSST